MIVAFMVCFFFFVCVAICVISHWHSQDEETKEFVNDLEASIRNSKTICIKVDGCHIMLREDFIEKEWNKTNANGAPIRGEYESAVHFMNRVKKYRKLMAERKNKKV